MLIALAIFAAPAVAGYAMVRQRPAVAYEIMPDVMLGRAAYHQPWLLAEADARIYSDGALPRTRAEARESVAQTRDPASAPIPDFVLDDIVRHARVGPLARFAATAATMDRYILDDAQLRALAVPARLIWGASDRLVPLDYAERMKAQLPDSTLTTLDRCGHVPQLECPDRLLAALKQALKTEKE